MMSPILTIGSNGFDYSVFKVIGSFVLVLVILVVCLKLLQKLYGVSNSNSVIIYSATIGQNRLIEHIKIDGKVHIVYKNEGSMAVLESIDESDYTPPVQEKARTPFLSKLRIKNN